jgi:hypothetical protein
MFMLCAVFQNPMVAYNQELLGPLLPRFDSSRNYGLLSQPLRLIVRSNQRADDAKDIRNVELARL